MSIPFDFNPLGVDEEFSEVTFIGPINGTGIPTDTYQHLREIFIDCYNRYCIGYLENNPIAYDIYYTSQHRLEILDKLADSGVVITNHIRGGLPAPSGVPVITEQPNFVNYSPSFGTYYSQGASNNSANPVNIRMYYANASSNKVWIQHFSYAITNTTTSSNSSTPMTPVMRVSSSPSNFMQFYYPTINGTVTGQKLYGNGTTYTRNATGVPADVGNRPAHMIYNVGSFVYDGEGGDRVSTTAIQTPSSRVTRFYGSTGDVSAWNTITVEGADNSIIYPMAVKSGEAIFATAIGGDYDGKLVCSTDGINFSVVYFSGDTLSSSPNYAKLVKYFDEDRFLVIEFPLTGSGYNRFYLINKKTWVCKRYGIKFAGSSSSFKKTFLGVLNDYAYFQFGSRYVYRFPISDIKKLP